MRDRFRLISNNEGPGTPQDAAGWVARMGSDQKTSDDVAAFESWSLENPNGRADYEAMADLMATLSRAGTDPVARRVLRKPLSPAHMGRRGVLAAVATAAAAVFVVSVSPSIMARPDTFETRVGETRRVALADGSVVVLNVASRMRVRMEDRERRVWLDHGQARFEVAKDGARPFRVFVGDREVRALGTTFDVRRLDAGVDVVLEEGSVGLYPADAERPEPVRSAGAPEVVLRPGQAATRSATAIAVTAVDPAVTGAWRFGRLVLDNRPLGEAVAEINRYNARTILLDDPSLAAMRISGVFRTGDPEAFVTAVSTILPVTVAAQDGDVLKLQRRAG